MKTLFDTSLLVQALERGLQHHVRAKSWLDRALGGEFQWAVATHSLAELYHVLTTLPVSPRIQPAEARRLIRENIESSAELVALTAKDYREVLDDLADDGFSDGVIYDALACKAARKANVKRLVTFNAAHFQRVWPEGAGIIQSP